jgi:hypothetical protein
MHAFSCTAAHTVNGHERGSLNRSAPVSYATTLSIHRALRLTLKDRGRAQRAVDTSRWLYNKIETKPERERLREFGGLPHCPGIVLASYAASLNTYSDLHKLWCAVLGLNQSPMRHWDYPVIHIAALLVSSSPYTDVASRDAVAKLRLDGTPTPRSLGGSDDEAVDTDRCRQERLPCGGSKLWSLHVRVCLGSFGSRGGYVQPVGPQRLSVVQVAHPVGRLGCRLEGETS